MNKMAKEVIHKITKEEDFSYFFIIHLFFILIFGAICFGLSGLFYMFLTDFLNVDLKFSLIISTLVFSFSFIYFYNTLNIAEESNREFEKVEHVVVNKKGKKNGK